MSAFFEPINTEILTRVIAGERSAQQLFYLHYVNAATTLARRLLGTMASQLAEEVVQDSFVDAYRRIAQLRDLSACGVWFRQLVVNRSLQALRSPWFRRRGKNAIDIELERRDEDEPTRDGPDAAHGLDLERALVSLPDAGRTVVVLHEIEGLTHREIAKQLNRSPSYSKSQLARALQTLRQRVMPSGSGGSEPEANSMHSVRAKAGLRPQGGSAETGRLGVSQGSRSGEKSGAREGTYQPTNTNNTNTNTNTTNTVDLTTQPLPLARFRSEAVTNQQTTHCCPLPALGGTNE